MLVRNAVLVSFTTVSRFWHTIVPVEKRTAQRRSLAIHRRLDLAQQHRRSLPTSLAMAGAVKKPTRRCSSWARSVLTTKTGAALTLRARQE